MCIKKVEIGMTRFEVLCHITDVKQFSGLIYEFVMKTGSVEALEKELSTEIPEEGLRTLQSIAQSGNYPLSFY